MTRQTPYQRLVARGVISPERHRALEILYRSLRPLGLRHQLDAALERLWKLALPTPRAQTLSRRPPFDNSDF
jgi:hypothetical protein